MGRSGFFPALKHRSIFSRSLRDESRSPPVSRGSRRLGGSQRRAKTGHRADLPWRCSERRREQTMSGYRQPAAFVERSGFQMLGGLRKRAQVRVVGVPGVVLDERMVRHRSSTRVMGHKNVDTRIDISLLQHPRERAAAAQRPLSHGTRPRSARSIRQRREGATVGKRVGGKWFARVGVLCDWWAISYTR